MELVRYELGKMDLPGEKLKGPASQRGSQAIPNKQISSTQQATKAESRELNPTTNRNTPNAMTHAEIESLLEQDIFPLLRSIASPQTQQVVRQVGVMELLLQISGQASAQVTRNMVCELCKSYIEFQVSSMKLPREKQAGVEQHEEACKDFLEMKRDIRDTLHQILSNYIEIRDAYVLFMDVIMFLFQDCCGISKQSEAANDFRTGRPMKKEKRARTAEAVADSSSENQSRNLSSSGLYPIIFNRFSQQREIAFGKILRHHIMAAKANSDSPNAADDNLVRIFPDPTSQRLVRLVLIDTLCLIATRAAFLAQLRSSDQEILIRVLTHEYHCSAQKSQELLMKLGDRLEPNQTRMLCMAVSSTLSNDTNYLGFGWKLGSRLSVLHTKTLSTYLIPDLILACRRKKDQSYSIPPGCDHDRERHFDTLLNVLQVAINMIPLIPATADSGNLLFAQFHELVFGLALDQILCSDLLCPFDLANLLYRGPKSLRWRVDGFPSWKDSSIPKDRQLYNEFPHMSTSMPCAHCQTLGEAIGRLADLLGRARNPALQSAFVDFVEKRMSFIHEGNWLFRKQFDFDFPWMLLLSALNTYFVYLCCPSVSEFLNARKRFHEPYLYLVDVWSKSKYSDSSNASSLSRADGSWEAASFGVLLLRLTNLYIKDASTLQVSPPLHVLKEPITFCLDIITSHLQNNCSTSYSEDFVVHACCVLSELYDLFVISSVHRADLSPIDAATLLTLAKKVLESAHHVRSIIVKTGLKSLLSTSILNTNMGSSMVSQESLKKISSGDLEHLLAKPPVTESQASKGKQMMQGDVDPGFWQDPSHPRFGAWLDYLFLRAVESQLSHIGTVALKLAGTGLIHSKTNSQENVELIEQTHTEYDLILPLAQSSLKDLSHLVEAISKEQEKPSEVEASYHLLFHRYLSFAATHLASLTALFCSASRCASVISPPAETTLWSDVCSSSRGSLNTWVSLSHVVRQLSTLLDKAESASADQSIEAQYALSVVCKAAESIVSHAPRHLLHPSSVTAKETIGNETDDSVVDFERSEHMSEIESLTTWVLQKALNGKLWESVSAGRQSTLKQRLLALSSVSLATCPLSERYFSLPASSIRASALFVTMWMHGSFEPSLQESIARLISFPMDQAHQIASRALSLIVAQVPIRNRILLECSKRPGDDDVHSSASDSLVEFKQFLADILRYMLNDYMQHLQSAAEDERDMSLPAVKHGSFAYFYDLIASIARDLRVRSPGGSELPDRMIEVQSVNSLLTDRLRPLLPLLLKWLLSGSSRVERGADGSWTTVPTLTELNISVLFGTTSSDFFRDIFPKCFLRVLELEGVPGVKRIAAFANTPMDQLIRDNMTALLTDVLTSQQWETNLSVLVELYRDPKLPTPSAIVLDSKIAYRLAPSLVSMLGDESHVNQERARFALFNIGELWMRQSRMSYPKELAGADDLQNPAQGTALWIRTHFLPIIDSLSTSIILKKKSLSQRTRGLNSLKNVIPLMSNHVHLFILKILATLKLSLLAETRETVGRSGDESATELEAFRVARAEAWRSLIDSMDAEHGSSHFATMLAILNPWLSKEKHLSEIACSALVDLLDRIETSCDLIHSDDESNEQRGSKRRARTISDEKPLEVQESCNVSDKSVRLLQAVYCIVFFPTGCFDREDVGSKVVRKLMSRMADLQRVYYRKFANPAADASDSKLEKQGDPNRSAHRSQDVDPDLFHGAEAFRRALATLAHNDSKVVRAATMEATYDLLRNHRNRLQDLCPALLKDGSARKPESNARNSSMCLSLDELNSLVQSILQGCADHDDLLRVASLKAMGELGAIDPLLLDAKGSLISGKEEGSDIGLSSGSDRMSSSLFKVIMSRIMNCDLQAAGGKLQMLRSDFHGESEAINGESESRASSGLRESMVENQIHYVLGRSLLLDHFVPALTRAKRETQNVIGFAIQEILQVCQCTLKTPKLALAVSGAKKPLKDGDIPSEGTDSLHSEGQLFGIRFWRALPRAAQAVLTPYLGGSFALDQEGGNDTRGGSGLKAPGIHREALRFNFAKVASNAWAYEVISTLLEELRETAIGKNNDDEKDWCRLLNAARKYIHVTDDFATTRFLLPIVVQDVFLLCPRAKSDLLVERFMEALKFNSACAHLVFHVLDNIKLGIREFQSQQRKQSKSHSAGSGGAMQPALTDSSLEISQKSWSVDKLNDILTWWGLNPSSKVSLDTLARGAASIRSYESAIMFMEFEARRLVSVYSKDPNDPSGTNGKPLPDDEDFESKPYLVPVYSFLQDAYQRLRDADSISGLAAIRHSSDLRARLVDAETAHDYQVALLLNEQAVALYERSISGSRLPISDMEDSVGPESYLSYLHCLRISGKWETMLNVADGLLSRSLTRSVDFMAPDDEQISLFDDAKIKSKIIGLGMEASWRLQRWDRLDHMHQRLSKLESQSHGADKRDTKDKTLLDVDTAFSQHLSAMFLSQLDPPDHDHIKRCSEAARKAIIPAITISADAYSRVYPWLCRLQVVSEVEDGMLSFHNKELLSSASLVYQKQRVLLMSPDFDLREPLLAARHSVLVCRKEFVPAAYTMLEMACEARRSSNFVASKAALLRARRLIQDITQGKQPDLAVQTSDNGSMECAVLMDKLRFVEAELMYREGQVYPAIQALGQVVTDIRPRLQAIQSSSGKLKGPNLNYWVGPARSVILKALLVLAKWKDESRTASSADIIGHYEECLKLDTCSWHSDETFYQLGRFYDQLLRAAANSDIKDAGENLPDGAKIRPLSSDTSTSAESGTATDPAEYAPFVMYYLTRALLQGTSYVHEIIPRMLTLIFDYLKHAPSMKESELAPHLNLYADANHETMILEFKRSHALYFQARFAVEKLPPWVWLSSMPQILSRVTNSSEAVQTLMSRLLQSMVRAHPYQALWHLLPITEYQDRNRVQYAKDVLKAVEKKVSSASPSKRIVSSKTDVVKLIADMSELVRNLIIVCKTKFDKEKKLSMAAHFRQVSRMQYPLNIMIPTAAAMAPSLDCVDGRFDNSDKLYDPCFDHAVDFAATARAAQYDTSKDKEVVVIDVDEFDDVANSTRKSRKAMVETLPVFPERVVTIDAFEDRIIVFTSAAKPKRIAMIGSDGKSYRWLCKIEERADIRKDARFMEYASVVNRLLIRNEDARGRDAKVRTYNVLPLNERCGIFEWQDNLVKLQDTMRQLYRRANVSWNPGEIQDTKNKMRDDLKWYKEWVLKHFPKVLHLFFLYRFGHNAKMWLRTQTTWSRSVAVWSMVGYVIGLGDRHADNLLIDTVSGQCVHVDFEMLFEKGITLTVPEKVPFRLTPNLVDAMGILGYHGTMTSTSRVVLSVLRNNPHAIVSVLETLIYDPFVDWNKSSHKSRTGAEANIPAASAPAASSRALKTIEQKLAGVVAGGLPLSVDAQVDRLIQEAVSHDNLAKMYIWWMAMM